MGKRPTPLRITNPAEDVPRLIQGSGKTPAGGTWGFALAPHESTGILLLAPKGGGVFRWDASKRGGDAPAKPAKAVEDLKSAAAELRAMAKGPSSELTPITLNGVWKGHMQCTPQGPRVVLSRPINSYTTLVLESHSERGLWRWTLQREARWFAKKGKDGGFHATLRGAIGKALAMAEGVVGPACTIKETRRRGSQDAGYTGRRGAVKTARESGRSATQVEVKQRKARAGRKPVPWRGFPFHTIPTIEVFSKPNQRQLKALERGGFQLRGSGEVFGRLAEPFEGLPGGSLVYAVQGDPEFHVGPVVKGGRIDKSKTARAGGSSSTSSKPKPAAAPKPAAKKPATPATSPKTWRDVVDIIEGVFTEGGLAEQLPGWSRRNMAIDIAKALRSGTRHDLIRPAEKLTVKAVSKVLGLKGKARPRSERAWDRLFMGDNLLPDVTGRMPAMSKSTASPPPARAPARAPGLAPAAKPAARKASSTRKRPTPKRTSKPKSKADKDAAIRQAVTSGVGDQLQMLFGAP